MVSGQLAIFAGGHIGAGGQLSVSETGGKGFGNTQSQRVGCHRKEVIRIGAEDPLGILDGQRFQITAEAQRLTQALATQNGASAAINGKQPAQQLRQSGVL